MRTPETILDELLVIRSQDGERAAQEALFRRWQPKLWPLARAWSIDEASAADALQEAWVSIFKGIRRLDDPAVFGAWSGRILKRRCADEVRRRTRQKSRDRSGAQFCAGPDEQAPSPEGGASALMRAIEELEPQTRALLRLFYVQEMSVGMIAQVMDIAPGTVKSRLFRARERLAERLAETEGGS